MRICTNCHVRCIGGDRHCPLCGSPLADEGPSEYAYPVYKIKRHVLGRILASASLSAVFIMFFVNYFTWQEAPYPWAAAAAVGILLSYLFARTWRSRRLSLGAKLFLSFIFSMVVIVYIDCVTGFDAWSTSYVIPISSSVLTIVLTILTMTGRKHYPSFFSYMMVFMIISLMSPLLYLLSLARIKWLGMLPLLCGIVCFTTLAIIRKRDIAVELRKRFRL